VFLCRDFLFLLLFFFFCLCGDDCQQAEQQQLLLILTQSASLPAFTTLVTRTIVGRHRSIRCPGITKNWGSSFYRIRFLPPVSDYTAPAYNILLHSFLPFWRFVPYSRLFTLRAISLTRNIGSTRHFRLEACKHEKHGIVTANGEG